MQNEKPLSGEESLKLITDTIYQAKGYYRESGAGGLIYGFSVLLCCVLSYLRNKNIVGIPFHPFCLMIPVFFVEGWVYYKEEKKKVAKTFTDEAIDYVWTGFFITVLAVSCAGFTGIPQIQYIVFSVIIMLAGLASYLTGMLAKFQYLVITGFMCLGAGIVSFFLLNPATYLVLAGVAFFVWIIPGFILNAHFKKLHHAG